MANMSERARGASGNAENVIPLHEVDANVIDPTITAELINDDLLAGIHSYAEKVLDKVLDNDRLEKQIDAHKRSASIIWTKVMRPVIKPVIVVAVIVTILGIGFSYFVEMSGTVMYALLEPFNNLRHIIFDPIFGTVQKAMLPPTP